MNVKLRGDIQQGLLKLDIHNDHTVKIINIPEHKMDLVGLRVLYDYCGRANRMELRYMATDLLYNESDKFKLGKSFKAYLVEAKWEHKVIFDFFSNVLLFNFLKFLYPIAIFC